MLDNAISLYYQYMADKGSNLTVGTCFGQIRDQTLPFMFEIDGDFEIDSTAGSIGPVKQYILPINPETYSMSTPSRASVTMTQAGSFQDNIGFGFPRFSIQGTFGFLGTLKGGHAQSLGDEKMDAWSMYMNLYLTFKEFYERFGTYTQRGDLVKKPVNLDNPPELRFYNFTDLEFWVVQIDRFNLLRNTQRRFLYQYDIQMTGLKRVKRPESADDLLSKLKNVDAIETSFLDTWRGILKGYAQVNRVISGIVQGVEGLKDDITSIATAVAAFRNGVTAVIDAPFTLVATSIDAVDSIINTAVSISDIPQEFICGMRKVKRSLLHLGLHEDKFHESTATTGTVSETGTASTATEIVTTTIPTTLTDQGTAVSMDTPETTLFDSSLENMQAVPATVEAIKDSDTIETIAYRTMGDARQWQQIAMLNNLEYPYIATGMDRFTPIISAGTMDPAYAGDNIITVPGMVPSVGDVLVINSGVEVVTVDSYNSEYGTILLSAPLENDYPDGAAVTRHTRALSVLEPGDKIRIPGNVDDSFAVVGDDTDFEIKIYGTDEYLDESGEQDSVTGDTETVSGVDNLVMQLRHRLMTIRGELAAVGHPDYGSYLPLIIGKTNTPVWLERAKLEAELTMLQDPRVDHVENVTLATRGTAIYIDADVYLAGQSNATTVNILIG